MIENVLFRSDSERLLKSFEIFSCQKYKLQFSLIFSYFLIKLRH